MLLQTIGDLLPAAVGVALSPVPIIAIILMLGTPRARSTGLAFTAGWAVGLAVVITLVVVAVGAGEGDDAGPSTFVSWSKVAIGALFLALAAKQWAGRPREGQQVEAPGWMATIDGLPAGRALVLGAALSGVNPKNLALTFAAAASIADGAFSTGGNVVAAVVFVVIGSLTVAGPTFWYLISPARAAKPLEALKDFMSAHNHVIMMVVLLLLGVKLVGNGLAGLAT